MKLSALNSPLKEDQKLAFDFALKNSYSFVPLKPGRGKSRVLIELREHLQKKQQTNCLIVCPSYLVTNWVDQIKQWAPRGTIITSIRKGKDIYELFDTDYCVISYDLAQKAEHLFEWADMVGLDEAHSIKSQKAKRTQFIHKSIFENSTKRLHLLTGTPIKNRVEEFYSLLALCNYNPHSPQGDFLDKFPDSITFADHFSFREEYKIQIGRHWVPIIKWNGIRNIPELKDYLKDVYPRIPQPKTQEPIFNDITVSNSPDLELINAFNAHFKVEGSDSVNPTAKASAALKKAPFTVKHAENLLGETDRVVIYSDHVEASEFIAQKLGTVALNGRIEPNKRMDLARRFQAGEGKFLVATIPALSSGVTLTIANHLILNDYPWVPGDLEQTILRILRIGQTKQCYIHRMVGSPQDLQIMEAIEKKQKTIDKIV